MKHRLLFLAVLVAFGQAGYSADHSFSRGRSNRDEATTSDRFSARAGRDAIALWCSSDGLHGDKAFDLKKFSGKKTFYEVMKDEKHGMKAAIDKDYQKTFHIADAQKFHQYATAFAPKVFSKVSSLFNDGEEGIDKLLGKLAVTQGDGDEKGEFTPAGLRVALRKVLNANSDLLTESAASKIPLTAAKIAPLLGIASGSGLIVRVDEENCFINYGYAPGDTEGDEKSGRSFDISIAEPALDPSDIDYLKSVGQLLDPEKDNSDFYRAMFKMLTKSDASHVSRLSPLGKTVLSRWAAIYSAEHDRWLMSDETAHDWQNALTEATLLSPYVTASGKVFFNGELSDGDPTNFFGVGTVGSGLGGKLGIQRRKFQTLVTDALREIPSGEKAVERVEAITGKQKDIFRGIMAYLNSKDSDQAEIRANSEEMAEAVVELMSQLNVNADKITKYLKAQQ